MDHNISAQPLHTREREQYERIYPRLVTLYPEPRSGLDFQTPFELLIATVLSAQCTDVRVNQATPALFARYPDAPALASAEVSDIEALISSISFYHMKARNIHRTAQILVANYGGNVPRTLTQLVTLPGAGRKTANVVLGNAFGLNEGIAVDTHVTRLSGRLGLSRQTTAERIERDLMAIVPRDEWTNVSHRLILHGRQMCFARNPQCNRCPLAPVCPTVRVQTSPTTL